MPTQTYMKQSLLFVFLFICTLSQAQDTVWKKTDIGILDSIQSDILKEKRFIEVFLPENYKPGSTNKYDVLYVLDGGNWNTGLINKVQHFVEGESYMPPTIVVSIMGIDRGKDLTPTHINDWKTSGGAANFLGYIKNELIPHIEKKYPSNGDNTLWGHSLGGLFVINALFNEPATFKTYIAVDPSLWYDDQYIRRIARDKLPALAGSNITLFISGRGGKDGEGMRIAEFDTVMKQLAPAGLAWNTTIYPNETHSSLRLKSTYDGLKYAYGWNNNRVVFHPQNGIFLKDNPMTIWYFGDTARVHYTIDGTAPTRSSAGVPRDIVLKDAAKLTVKEFTNRARYDKVSTGEFVSGKALKAIPKPYGWEPGGFHYAYYEGKFDKATDVKDLQAERGGLTDSTFDTEKLPLKKDYLVIANGLFEAKEAGYYIFILDADKNSKLYINDQLLIDWQGSYTNRSYSYIVPMEKGFHPFRLEFFRSNPDFGLRLSYMTPSAVKSKGEPQPIPVDIQYAQRKKR